MLNDVLVRSDLFKKKKQIPSTSTFISKALTICVPVLILLYLIFFFQDIARNPVARTSETIVAADGEDNGSPIPFLCLSEGGCLLYTEYTAQPELRGQCARGYANCQAVAFNQRATTTMCYSTTISDGIYVLTFADAGEATIGAIVSGKHGVRQYFSMGDTLAQDGKSGKSLSRAITVDASSVAKTYTYYSYWINGASNNIRSMNMTLAKAAAVCGAASNVAAVQASMFFRGVGVIFETRYTSRLVYSFTAIGGFFALVFTLFGAAATAYRIATQVCCKSESETDSDDEDAELADAKAAKTGEAAKTTGKTGPKTGKGTAARRRPRLSSDSDDVANNY
eukprot:c10263_g1_i2.p1 GENE.c10263_g1_i2~~c10263_g1_i2.p1  ORF type:complete len:338 (-),score=60.88 c10263_g1_i2:5-1018(-)